MQFTDKDQFKNGKAVESWLDTYFKGKGWTIRQATDHEERTLCLGDRHFTKGEYAYWIEYKSGIQTHYTGNVFLETISVDTQNKPGWIITCKADYIFYAALLDKMILVFSPNKLRGRLMSLRENFREVPTCNGQNNGYNTHGLLVPLPYARRELSDKVIML